MTKLDDACDLINKTLDLSGDDCITPEKIEEAFIRRGMIANSFRHSMSKRYKVISYFTCDMRLTDLQRNKLWRELRVFFKIK